MGAEWQGIPFGHVLAESVRNGIYKPKQYHGRGAKIVNMGELFAHSRLRAVSMKRVEITDSEANRFLLSEGDLLFARRSLVAEGAGKCSIVLGIDEPTTFESSIIRARPDRDRADPLFLYYFFNSPAGLHALGTIRRQVAVAGITGSELSRLEVPAAPLPEQRRIASILGALDDKIELNRQMNHTLEEIAQAMFKSWFIDFDGHDDLVESELGLIPRGWEVKPLDVIAHFLNGVACQKYPALDDGESLPVIKIRELRQGVTDSTDRANLVSAKYLVNDGDLLFSWSGTLIVDIWCGGRGALNQHVFKVTSADYPKWFVMHWIGHYLEEFQGIAADKATTMGHIKRGHLAQALVAIPPSTDFPAVDGLMSPLVARHFLNRLESRTLAALRDALLPKLISGEIRVPEAEEILEDAL